MRALALLPAFLVVIACADGGNGSVQSSTTLLPGTYQFSPNRTAGELVDLWIGQLGADVEAKFRARLIEGYRSSAPTFTEDTTGTLVLRSDGSFVLSCRPQGAYELRLIGRYSEHGSRVTFIARTEGATESGPAGGSREACRVEAQREGREIRLSYQVHFACDEQLGSLVFVRADMPDALPK